MALRLSPAEMAELVPEAKDWPGGVYGWITSMGGFAAMIGYAEILWPDFTEIDGCVFRVNVEAAEYQAWMERLSGDRSAVERVCNHIDLLYLIRNYTETASDAQFPFDAQLTYVGQLLQETWEAKLAREYPDRRFAVEHHDDPSNPDDEPLITFSQIRDA